MPSLCQLSITLTSENALQKIRLTNYDVSGLLHLLPGIALAHLSLFQVQHLLLQIPCQGDPLDLQLVVVLDALIDVELEEGGSFSGSLT